MSSTGNNKDMKLICVICNQKIDDKYGHNPKPVNGTGTHHKLPSAFDLPVSC